MRKQSVLLLVLALAYASKYFNEPSYLALAEKAGDYYYENHLAKGYVGGGPAEILQAPDSESSGELAESFTALYEITRDEKWLKRACDAAAYFSTWVVSYDYKFPENSIFGQHGIQSAGSVTERVNIGDWEGESGIGNIPRDGSNIAWENTTLFHTTENPGIYVQPDKGEITVFDHVTARIVSSDASSVTLEISNPTYRDGDISVLAETSGYAQNNSLGWNAFYTWPKVHVPSGGTVTVTLPVNF